MKFSNQIAVWLKELGYTHYFYVGGGNIMHLTESLSQYLKGIPVVHEVAAGICAEYFNEISNKNTRALALVTAGPGLTNIVTSLSGAWLESRELLVIGGQVKVSDLSNEDLRSRGIQEIKGVDLVKTITKIAKQINTPIGPEEFINIVSESWKPRKGPVFLEIPIDIQACTVSEKNIKKIFNYKLNLTNRKDLEYTFKKYNASKKPILLIGGGVDYYTMKKCHDLIVKKKIPIMTTYNGADRFDPNINSYFGRPNTWGQRSSNIIIQEADLIIAIGTRLGLQQTGFNWQEFGRNAHIIQIDIDEYELKKGHPNINKALCVDANDFIVNFIKLNLNSKKRWLDYCNKIRNIIPRIEKINKTGREYISPYEFIVKLENLTKDNDLIIPCSSGSAFTLTMQLYKHKYGQRIITNKSLAAMGYGLSGSIGACIGAGNKKRTILIEGDGGFSQNLQEIGTAEINKLNIKIFIFNDQGHASIRMTQQNYFEGKYLGCDHKSGLRLPDWIQLFKAWNINVTKINKGFENDQKFITSFNSKSLCAFIVQIDPEQTYYPKISSKIIEKGDMISNPIDRMSPEINYTEGINY